MMVLVDGEAEDKLPNQQKIKCSLNWPKTIPLLPQQGHG